MESNCAVPRKACDADASCSHNATCFDSTIDFWHVSRTPNNCQSMACVLPCFGTWTDGPPSDTAQQLASCASKCLPNTLVAATTPQQVHLAIAGKASDQVVVSWITEDMTTTPRVLYGKTDDTVILTATGEIRKYDFFSDAPDYVAQQHEYHSGLIHHTVLTGLRAATEYWYEFGGADSAANRRTFVSPPRVGPLGSLPYAMGITGDLGQTNDSNTNMIHWAEDKDLQSVLCVGDESYADSLQARWDSWGRMVEVRGAWWCVVRDLPPGNGEVGGLVGEVGLVWEGWSGLVWFETS